MKTYIEMAESALHRVKEREEAQKHRRKIITQIAAPTLCVCLVAMIGVSMWKNGEAQAIPPAEEETPPAARVIAVEVNEVKSSTAAAKLYFDPAIHCEEEWDENKAAEYFGIDCSKLEFRMPGWEYTGKTDSVVSYIEDGSLLYDWNYFHYTRWDKQGLTISVGKCTPPYDCIYLLESEAGTPFKTATGGMEVILGGIPKEKGVEYESVIAQNFAMYEQCFADFEQEGVYYRVEATNVTANEFYGIVQDIIY